MIGIVTAEEDKKVREQLCDILVDRDKLFSIDQAIMNKLEKLSLQNYFKRNFTRAEANQIYSIHGRVK